MTVKETLDCYKGKFADVEFYTGNGHGFHTDNIRPVENYSGSETVIEESLMDEETYANSINANSCVDTDFAAWFGSKTAKILCVKIKCADLEKK